MDLSINEIEKHLCKIFVGQEIVCFNDGNKDTRLLFKQPDNLIKLHANDVYDRVYQEAVKDGILPLKELEKLITKRGLFTEEDQRKVNSLKSKLEAQQVLLSKTTRVRARSDRVKEAIKDLEQQIRKIEYRKFSKLAMSAETKAEEDRSSYLCWSSVYDIDTDKLYWKEYKDFLNETNLVFRANVLTGFLKFYGGIDTKIIRFIARGSLWRIRYITSQKTGEQLFGVPTSRYTNDMMNLAYYSNFYQNIYEMIDDKPSDLIIEDDDALDSFMKAHYEERNREEMARKSKHKTQGKLSAFDQEEVIVTRSNELYEDIEYNKPREAKLIKEKTDIKKKARHRR